MTKNRDLDAAAEDVSSDADRDLVLSASPALLVKVFTVVVFCMITMLVGQYLVIAGVAWLAFPDVLNAFLGTNLKESLPNISPAFWWLVTACLVVLAYGLGIVARKLLHQRARSMLWLVTLLLFLMYFQQFLGPDAPMRWLNLLLSLLVPTSFVIGSRAIEPATDVS